MKLFYYKGQNFGDAINPLLFEKLLPGFFDGRGDELFVGIGSILGAVHPGPECKRVIIFSSGFAAGDPSTYGTLARPDARYEVLCVRGPLTAEKMGIPSSLAISDGALLLPRIFPAVPAPKKYPFSYMPHVGSLDVYDKWEELCTSRGIHLIDPRADPMQVITEMCGTGVLLAEAMHGAIVADAYQVPWIPVKTSKTINDFKWKDYLASVGLEYHPNTLRPIYSRKFLSGIFRSKLGRIKLSFLARPAAGIYYFYQSMVILPAVKRSFKKLKQAQPFLCDSNLLKLKQDQLLQTLEHFKKKEKIA